MDEKREEEIQRMLEQEALESKIAEANLLRVSPEQCIINNGSIPEWGYILSDNNGGYRITPPLWTCMKCGHTFPLSQPANKEKASEPLLCENETCARKGPFRRYPEGTPPIIPEPPWLVVDGIEETTPHKIWNEMRESAYHQIYFADEVIYDIFTAWNISTYFRDEFENLSHIFLLGPTEHGKSRCLKVMKQFCYRADLIVSLTASTLFRGISNYGLTALISEYHDLRKDEKAEVDAIIKGGQSRDENVWRNIPVGKDYVPHSFNPFTHVGMGAQYLPKEDVLNRSFFITMVKNKRPVRKRLDRKKGAEIRRKLLWCKFRYRNVEHNPFYEAVQKAEKWLDDNKIEGRVYDRFSCIIPIVFLFTPNPERVAKKIIEYDRKTQKETSFVSLDRLVMDALINIVKEGGIEKQIDLTGGRERVMVKLTDLHTRILQMGDMTEKSFTAHKLGHILKRHNFNVIKKRDGRYIDDPNLLLRLKEYATLYELEGFEAEEKQPEAKEIDVSADARTDTHSRSNADKRTQTQLSSPKTLDDHIFELVDKASASDQRGCLGAVIVKRLKHLSHAAVVHKRILEMVKEGKLVETEDETGTYLKRP